MDIPADRRYAGTHEWHKLDGDMVVIGLSQHAVNELTDITYVEFPDVGQAVAPGQAFGEIESVKATSELCSAVAGEVVEINDAVTDDPAVVNRDPYGRGWLIKVKCSDLSVLDALMSAEAYQDTLP